MDNFTALNMTILIKTLRIFTKAMIKQMTVTKQLYFVGVNIRETQAMPHSKAGFSNVKGFFGKLPENRAYDIVPILVPAI